MSSNGHNSNSKTKANVHSLYYLRLPSQMAIGKVKRGKERLRDFYENCYVCKPYCIYNRPAVNSNANIWERDFCKKSFKGSSSRNLSQMRLQQQKKGIRDFYENHYQQQQAIYICAISNDATAAAINRWTGLGKPISHFNFHSSIFPQHQQQQFLQRESMPKPPLINNIDLILFYYFVTFVKFWV